MTPAPLPRPPWEKQQKETTPAFAAFVSYRDMGSARSTAKVAQDVGKSKALIQGWSKKHHWVDRVDAWDRHMDARHREATALAWERANDRHQAIVSRVTTGLHARLEGEGGVTALDPADLDWGDVRGLMRDSITLERLVNGQPTDFALRATSMTITEALGHVRMLIECARRAMTPEQFQSFMADYSARTAAQIDMPPAQQAIEA